jgi:hypothetical protein
MGRSYAFECSKCGYRTAVAGKADGGVSFSVQTIACRECKVLYDAVTRVKARVEPLPDWRNVAGAGRGKPAAGRWSVEAAPSFLAALNRLPVLGGGRFRWIHFKLRCPASPLHRIQVWNDPGKCPRCGAYLDKSGVPFRIWE